MKVFHFYQKKKKKKQVEHIIKEQNMLDACVMVEGYCNLLMNGSLSWKIKSQFFFGVILVIHTFVWRKVYCNFVIFFIPWIREIIKWYPANSKN